MRILEILNKINSKVIYLLVSVVVLVPLLMTIPVEVEPDDNARIVFDTLSEILKSNESITVDSSIKVDKSNDKHVYDRPDNSSNKSSGNNNCKSDKQSQVK